MRISDWSSDVCSSDLDTVARVVAQGLTLSMGQPVVVANKPGANGVVAAQALASSPADGYSYLVTDGSMLSINPSLYKDQSYDPKRDFVPVSLTATSPPFLAPSPPPQRKNAVSGNPVADNKKH